MLTARFFRTAARLPSPARLIGGSRFSSTVYTKEHEYAKIAGDIATCGISNYAQAALGDVVFVSLPAVGASFKKGFVLVLLRAIIRSLASAHHREASPHQLPPPFFAAT